MSFTVVIPARYGSTRLPGKPLLDIDGVPMIQRVWQQAGRSAATRVVIATDDARVEEAARSFGAEVCMTSAQHPSGTDRLEEVARKLHLDADAVVVNVQGDEPLIPPAVINQVADNLSARQQVEVATLCEPITGVGELTSPHVVKVVTGDDDLALYFSRAPVPWPRDTFDREPDQMPQEGRWLRHIGIYAYRAGFLHKFVAWPPAPAEQLEHLEQLRALHYGVGIHVAEAVEAVPGGVDTEVDLELVRTMVREGDA